MKFVNAPLKLIGEISETVVITILSIVPKANPDIILKRIKIDILLTNPIIIEQYKNN